MSEFDFYSEERGKELRPTPFLKFKIVYVPAPEYGKDVAKGEKVLHQKFIDMVRTDNCGLCLFTVGL